MPAPSSGGSRPPRVAVQGDVGSFSGAAAAAHWPGGFTLLPCPGFAEAVETLLARQADSAVLPLENAIAGPVMAARAVLDAARDRLRVLTEVTIPIQLCLVGVAGTSPEQLREVHSHPVALAQCSRFFQAHPWIRPVAHLDTAGAARDIARLGDPATAAIASAAAAEAHRLVVVREAVQDRPDNWTRFAVLARLESDPHP